jgi:hypothetical protein
MKQIFSFVEERFSGPSLADINPSSVNIALSLEKGLMGFVLGNEVLLLRHKEMTTFRVNFANIGSIKGIQLFKHPNLINQDQLKAYFAENGDNPYALQNIMGLLNHNRPLDNPTQLPPLWFPKTEEQQAEAIDKLFDLAQPFDLFFTFTRSSGLSNMIRYIDRGHWSHTGVLDANKHIVEATTSGVHKSRFDRLKDPLLDVGLYRIKSHQFSPEQRERMQAFTELQLRSKTSYDWSVIPLAILRKWFNKPSICPMMPSDLIRLDGLQLIGYA